MLTVPIFFPNLTYGYRKPIGDAYPLKGGSRRFQKKARFVSTKHHSEDSHFKILVGFLSCMGHQYGGLRPR